MSILKTILDKTIYANIANDPDKTTVKPQKWLFELFVQYGIGDQCCKI